MDSQCLQEIHSANHVPVLRMELPNTFMDVRETLWPKVLIETIGTAILRAVLKKNQYSESVYIYIYLYSSHFGLNVLRQIARRSNGITLL